MTKNKRPEVLVLIPARGGSKGVPRKNLALIGEKPLVQYTIEVALATNFESRICLSTDDAQIRSLGLRLGVEAPFIRPQQLATDDSDILLTVRHCLDWYLENEGFDPKYIILLQPTCPFRTADSVIEALKLISKENAGSLISVNPVIHHPCEYIAESDGRFHRILELPEKPNRQNFPEVFFINGAIYITKASFFRSIGKLYDEEACLYRTSRTESFDIDDPEDLDYARWLHNERQQKTMAPRGVRGGI